MQKNFKEDVMKKLTTVSIILFILIHLILPVYAEAPDIHSPSAILIDAASGRILFEKNIHEKMYPASITKIMTAILALENGSLEDMVTASYDAVMNIELGSSNIGILPDEQLSLKDLLYGLLITSGNECANIIAGHISGSIEEFVTLMNQRAQELGAKNTHFANTNGLHDDNHYTTAYDMSLIAKHAMTIPTFREIVKTVTYELPPTNKTNERRYLSNTNLLINYYKSKKYLYQPAIGIKTGYTTKAGHTLVAAAKQGDMELISVVLGATLEGYTNYSYEDTRNLFKYGFSDFSIQTVVNSNDIVDEVIVKESKNNEHVLLLTQQSLSALLPKDIDKNAIVSQVTLNDTIKAPISKNDILGVISYTYNDQLIGQVNLVADRDVERDPFQVFKSKVIACLSVAWVRYILYALVFIIILRTLDVVLKANRKKRRRLRRVRNVKYMHK